MRYLIPPSGALVIGFLYGRGLEMTIDLVPLLVSIVAIYAVIAFFESRDALPRPRTTTRVAPRRQRVVSAPRRQQPLPNIRLSPRPR